MLGNVVRTLGTQVDDELHVLFEHRRSEASQRVGHEISASTFLRSMLRRDLNVSSNSKPFDEGWLEGYKAGYAEVMRAFHTAIHDVATDKIHADDLEAARMAGGG